MRVRINEPRSTGPGRFQINVRSRPIEFNLDPAELGAGIADAIRDAIAAGIAAITERVAPATVRYREEARRALARGARWAVDRFGRHGVPAGDRLFAGLDQELEVQPDGDTYRIGIARPFNAPGASPEALLDRLRELVPAITDPFSSSSVQAAIAEAWAKLVRRL